MPLYDYRCLACDRITEVLQKYEDPPLTICPHCGGEMRKLISAPAFQFKGSGWYVTDYARKSGSSAAGEGASGGESKGQSGGESGGKEGGASAGEAKSESKGESRSESKGESKSDSKKAESTGSGGSSPSPSSKS